MTDAAWVAGFKKLYLPDNPWTAVQVAVKAVTTVGSSAETSNNILPPCLRADSYEKDGVCWRQSCPVAQYRDGAECLNMTNSTCPRGEGYSSASSYTQSASIGVVVTPYTTNSNINGTVIIGDSHDPFHVDNTQCGDTVTSSTEDEEYEFWCDVSGRFIYVTGFVNAKGALGLFQVEVEIDDVTFDGGIADQSSTFARKEAQNARVTGSGDFSVARPQYGIDTWWRLDTGITLARTGSTENDGICSSCTAGLFKNTSNTDSCQVCPRGWYTNEPSATACHACPKGFYNSNVGKPSCAACTTGRFNDLTTQIFPSSSYCKPCAAGKIAPVTNSTMCLDCPKGTFLKDTTGNRDRHDQHSDCENCSIAKYNPFHGHDSACFDCPAAKTTGSIECEGCAPGQFENVTGVDSSKCSMCPAGYYTNDRDLQDCAICHSGFYGSEQRPFKTCHACPRGQFGVASASVSKSSGCENCTSGRYSEVEAIPDSGYCTGCPTGKWSSGIGVTKESACINCGTGKYGVQLRVPMRKPSCEKCNRGYFLGTVGSYGDTKLRGLPIGFRSKRDGGGVLFALHARFVQRPSWHGTLFELCGWTIFSSSGKNNGMSTLFERSVSK